MECIIYTVTKSRVNIFPKGASQFEVGGCDRRLFLAAAFRGRISLCKLQETVPLLWNRDVSHDHDWQGIAGCVSCVRFPVEAQVSELSEAVVKVLNPFLNGHTFRLLCVSVLHL